MSEHAAQSTLPLEAETQRQLLKEPVFRALFITQFSGAFNDNLYKSALLMLFTYGGLYHWGLGINVINNVVAATLIIPFLIFATVVGQLADKYERSRMIQRIKLIEIVIMCAGFVALLLESPLALLLVLLATGTQSASFSPLKYAIVPNLLKPQALVGGNALIHTGTSFAIFLGLISGSLLVQLSGGHWWVGALALAFSFWGWHSSRQIPPVSVANPGLALQWNPWTQTCRTLRFALVDKGVFWTIIGISWYWFMGSVYLTQIPNLARELLNAHPLMVPILLILFLAGLGVGSLLCEKLSAQRIEPGLVPLGALGVALVGTDLACSCYSLAADTALAGPELISMPVLLANASVWRLMVDLLLLGVSGGLYLVPLSSLLQSRSDIRYRAQIMAANNVINALFMVLASVLSVVVLGHLHLLLGDLFLVVAVLHVVLCALLFFAAPEFLQRAQYRVLAVLGGR